MLQSQTTQNRDTLSNLQWEGLHPQRFSGGRLHLRAKDVLKSNNLEVEAEDLKGRKHF